MKDKHIKIATSRFGKVNPLSLEEYINTDGLKALKIGLQKAPKDLLLSIEKSGLRGRGGAGFPTGLKQKFTSESCEICNDRYIICNADEGEP